VRRGPREGEQIAITDIDMTEAQIKVELQNCKLLGSKTSLAGGVRVRLFEVENEWRERGLKAVSRLDEKGLILSDHLPPFERRLEPEAQAKNIEYSQDLFVMGLAKLDGALGDPRQVSELVLEVTGDDAAFPEGPRQCLAPGQKGGRLLKIGKAHGKAAPVSDEDARTNLAETASYPISDARIQKLARQAIGDAQTPAEKVRRLVKFTHEYVKPAFSATLPQIHDLLDNKKGDCKSYALLLTTLARAAGIPSREVSGLLYVGDDYKAFGGHAWNEVVLDGVWVPVDASLNETEVNAAHVSFGSEQRAIANLLNTLGKLSFRLVEVKHAR
jgi:hypothetical protein